MRSRALGWIPMLLTLIGAALPPAGAANRCTLKIFPPLPVRMEERRPVVSAEIDGTEGRFIVDTGSFVDFLSPAAAAELKLPLSYAPPWYRVIGLGGSFVPKIATAKTFTLDDFTFHDALFLVGNNDFQGGIVGVLGQRIFRVADIDFDFANGALRFVQPQHCDGHILAYWATTQAIGSVNIHWTSEEQPHLLGGASVNGHDVEVLFDTGSWRTILSLAAAKRAGITPDSPGVVPAGESIGMGNRPVKVWVAPVASFEIGGETIEHTHVLIGDIGLHQLGADMLLGSDFFLAHHVYVAYSQNEIYFTYNGGPVFDFRTRPAAQAAPAPVSDVPTDAAGYLRRGMADASRGEFAQAITDFTRACELQPTDGDCRYQRGLAYWHSAQTEPALADFNAAIQRRPDDFEAYLARAQLDVAKQPGRAETDLEAVDRLAPQDADLRLQLARLYDDAGEYAGAVHQYDLWIDYHPRDIRLASALGGRCGSEAAANVDLDRAVDDCTTLLKLNQKSGMTGTSAMALSNRGLAYLRQGRLDSALSDLQGALKLQPQFALARYELGLVELKKGLTAAGRADLAAAQADGPGLAKRFSSMGLTP